MIPGKNILVIYSSKDTPGMNDADGAFIPQAIAFARVHGVPPSNMHGIPCPDLSNAKRFDRVLSALHNSQGLRQVAMFCHGWSSGLQFGLNKLNIPQLVQGLSAACVPEVKLTLYACSTASTNKNTRNIKMPGTDNGYADKLRDKMLEKGFKGGWVDAHLQKGHTTENPFMIRFYTEPRFENDWDLPGGEWLVSPKSALWPKWKKAVQDDTSPFRFKFGQMTEAEIYAYLATLPS